MRSVAKSLRLAHRVMTRNSVVHRHHFLHGHGTVIAALVVLLLIHGTQALALTPTVTPQKSIVVSFRDSTASGETMPTLVPAPSAPEDTAVLTATTTRTPASAPAPATTPTPAPALTNDMRKILRKVGSIPCVEPTRSRMFAILYESNVALHDTCIADSGYQFFPYTGELPTTAQIVATVKSIACMQLYAGVILAEFPECDIDFVSVRSSAEVFYRIKKDVDAERVPPTQAQFYEFYNLNRVVNLLNENASLIEDVFRENPATAAVSLSEMTRLMNPIVLLPGVTLGADMSITVAAPTPTDASSSSSSSSGSMDDAGNSALNVQATPAPAPSRLAPVLANTTNHTSDAYAATRAAGSAWRSRVGVAVAAAVLGLMMAP